MADFLLELFSEEIPARMQAEAARHLKASFEEAFKAAALSSKSLQSFVTPRRLALLASDLPTQQEDATIEKKGPRTSAPQAAIDGFLKSSGLTLDKLEKRMLGRDETYFAVIHQKGQPTAQVLKTIIEKILADFPWSKSMRWGSGETRWVRPLHSILCLFDGTVVPVEFAGIKAGNVTYGHRFLAPAAITIKKEGDYETALKIAKMIANAEDRKAEILKQAEALAGKQGLTLRRDDGLLAEVTGLVEWPTALMGTIDAKFMDLPPEVLTSEMRAHQKYFALLKKDGGFSDRFLIISNMVTEDGGKAVVAGNERVLRARLSDGRFFFDQDRKKPLSEWAKGLADVTFHAKLGTIAQKVERIEKLAAALTKYVPGAEPKLTQQAARLSKADLTTGMVGEFPELQGVMGRYYALAQKEDAAVADAIRDHYLPLGPDSPIPTKPISICIALADKLDTLISMFAANEKPTGSKDPFALRRSALGIIRIILENNIRLKLGIILSQFHVSLSLRERSGEGQHGTIPPLAPHPNPLPEGEGMISTGTTQELIAFFRDRLKVMLRDQGIRHDVVDAVMANGDDDLVRVVARAKALQAFLATESGTNLLAAYKRASNIVSIEEKKDKTTYTADKLNAKILKEAEEKNLSQGLGDTLRAVENYTKQEQFEKAMEEFSKLRQYVDPFFDKVLVNCEDRELRTERLRLLARIRDNMDSIADFGAIEDAAALKKAA